jgi:ADP-ribose pyrophosphatase YjhB (NUDIX family)
VGAIIIEDSRVLLVERDQEPLKGYWSLPGGVLEVGEGVEDAVRREVREETGLEVTPHGPAEVFERIIPDAAGRAEYHYVLLDYPCNVVGGTLRAGDDASRAAWFERSQLAGLPLTTGTLPVIEKAFDRQAESR